MLKNRKSKLAGLSKKENKGITVMALVITVVIMLILAGVSISLLSGENGLINKAVSSRNNYKLSEIDEKLADFMSQESDADITDAFTENIITLSELEFYSKHSDKNGANKVIFIKTADDLARIGLDENYPLDGIYIQLSDIDLSSKCSESSGTTWKPIGNYGKDSQKFTGIFNANNHSISGLYINNDAYRANGLFGWNSGRIKNLTLESGSVYATTIHTGGIAGINSGIIENCTNKINITSDNTYIGGIVGTNRWRNITKLYKYRKYRIKWCYRNRRNSRNVL